MISKQYFETTFSLATAQALQTWAEDNLITQSPTPDNPYLEPVNIPPYVDTGDDTDGLITTANGRWNSAYLNRSDIKNFYIEPGDYTATVPVITTSGTAIERRYLSLYNGNDTHPGMLDKATQLANYRLTIKGSSYWTIDRPSCFDTTVNPYTVERGDAWEASQYNIFNRMFTNNIGVSLYILDNSHHTTIQNSRLDTMIHSSRIADDVCIEVRPRENLGITETKGVKIINNEIINQNDGIQFVSSNYEAGVEYNGEGSIVDSNDIYFTSAVYSDELGNADTSGDYMTAENTIDMKYGSTNPANPMIFSNNNLWGQRKSATIGNISAVSNVTIHFGAFNISFVDNYIFDSYQGVATGASGGFTHAWSGELSRNTFDDCGFTGVNSGRALIIANCQDATIEDNLIFSSNNEHLKAWYCYANTVVRNNLALDSADWILDANSSSGSTYSYAAANDNGGSYQQVTAASQGYTEDYTFTTDKFTNSPRVITLSNVVKP